MAAKKVTAAPGTVTRGGKGAVSSTFQPTFGAARSTSSRKSTRKSGRAMTAGRGR